MLPLISEVISADREKVMGEIRYRRILLKLSGEALMGSGGFGIDPVVISRIADEIAAAYNYDLQKSEAIKERDMTEKQAEGAR